MTTWADLVETGSATPQTLGHRATIYRALNRGHAGSDIFRKEADFYVERHALPANWVRRAEDWRWGSRWQWLQERGTRAEIALPLADSSVSQLGRPSQRDLKNEAPKSIKESFVCPHPMENENES